MRRGGVGISVLEERRLSERNHNGLTRGQVFHSAHATLDQGGGPQQRRRSVCSSDRGRTTKALPAARTSAVRRTPA